MGRITCANVLSDLFAMGVTQIDSVDVVLKLSSAMTDQERLVVTPLLLKGFSEAAADAGTRIHKITAVENPWCTLGGIATAVLHKDQFILPVNAQSGDLLVLTKPLGTQVACAANTPSRYARLVAVTTTQELDELLAHATYSMGRLNLLAAQLMHKYKAQACTDVTGFGLLGHAANLASFQKNPVNFVLNVLPLMQHALKVSKALGMGKLTTGISPETSGGLLIAFRDKDAMEFCKDMMAEGQECWIVGTVTEGAGTAHLSTEPEIIEVPLNIHVVS